MKMNLNQIVTLLSGEPLKEKGEIVYMNKVLANSLAVQTADNHAIQKLDLAIKLYNSTGDIEISESEKLLMKQVCENSQMIVLVAAQILNVINNAKD